MRLEIFGGRDMRREEILESAIRHIDEYINKFWINMTLDTGLTQEEIEENINLLLDEFLSSLMWCRIWLSTNKFKSYNAAIPADITFEGYKILDIIKILDNICPKFKLNYALPLFSNPSMEICFDIYNEDAVNTKEEV